MSSLHAITMRYCRSHREPNGGHGKQEMGFGSGSFIPKSNTSMYPLLPRQVASALTYMESEGVFHGDIKPENLIFETPVHERKDCRNIALSPSPEALHMVPLPPHPCCSNPEFGYVVTMQGSCCLTSLVLIFRVCQCARNIAKRISCNDLRPN
jgi:serine/threonine protein kinase